MKKKELGRTALILGIMLVSCMLWACSGGDTDGGSAQDQAAGFGEDHFVADENSVGRIEVDVNETTMQVSETSGFSARVFDASGVPVENMKVSCDTEVGLAVLEPTTGTEITDSFGQISGIIGCASPGSLKFGCRVQVGANFRKLVTIKCSGPIPTGFGGFPGAAGGGLGTGGVADNDDGGVGGVDPDGIRITSLAADDSGGSGTSTSIDTRQGTCDDNTAELFFDTTLNIKVINNTNSTIRFSKLNYTIDNATGSGTSNFNSRDIALIGEVGPSGDSQEFQVLAFDASGGSKFFVGSSTAIPAALGFRNVKVKLTGTTDLGDTVIVSGQTVLSFDNFDNCT